MQVPNYDIKYPVFHPAIHRNNWHSSQWKITYNLFGVGGEYKLSDIRSYLHINLGKHHSNLHLGQPQSYRMAIFMEGVSRDTLLDTYIKDPYVKNIAFRSFGTTVTYEELCEPYGVKELTLDLFNAYYTAVNRGATLKKFGKVYPPLFKKLLHTYLKELSQKSSEEFETYVNDSQYK